MIAKNGLGGKGENKDCLKENMALIELYICVVLHAHKTDVT